jgi:peroxiredoxin
MSTTLSEELEEYRASWKARVPAERQVTMERHIEHLAESGIGRSAKQVGDAAPPIVLTDQHGAMFDVATLLAKGPVVVTFYRGGWCPFCNIQLHDLGAAKAEFDKRGVKLVAISVDKPSEEAKMQAKDGVPFPMLSDPKLVALKGFKVVHVADEEQIKKMTGFGIDLTSYSGETHKSFAVPAVYLVDKTGVVRFAHVDEDYKTRPSVKQLLGVADKLGAK